ncbi:hypothetical protein [Methylovulum psychrotolerans]|uniref:Oligosaccharide repeat unit polymerase n=1 Tax=Methylovulum psychrotolerans TaxID=1704499 RepID=A0A1Z4BWS7_9GAMM|nr:hypothetical protein [Methylovulum psychrotolerans]ASF45700.1 hypothetical protein CEK71_06220 [Methylovulum psychrotolerans]
MSILLFFILIVISLSMVVWGLMRPERIFQFPLLAGSVWLLYICPQALGVLINPYWIPIGAQRDNGIEMALIMANLCAGMSFWGYLKPTPKSNYSLHPAFYSYSRFFLGGCMLIAIAFFSFYKLAGLSGGLVEHYSVEGNYELEWTGLPVAYVFFVRLIYPGLMLCLLAALHKPTTLRILTVFIGTLLPLANVFLLGRRTEAVFLLLTFGLCFFFQKRWIPRRSLVITMIILGGIMVMVMPSYRSHSQIGADYSEILEMDIEKIVTSQVEGKEPVEFIYPVVQLPATQQAFEFNYGLGFYNRLIKEWVPALFVGREFKSTLMIDGPDFAKHTINYYSWEASYGWIPLGMTDAFREFWFFGAFLYFLIGRGFRFIWDHAHIGSDMAYKVFYITLASEAMLTILHGVTPLPFFIVYAILSLTPIILYSRVYPRNYHRTGLRSRLTYFTGGAENEES